MTDATKRSEYELLKKHAQLFTLIECLEQQRVELIVRALVQTPEQKRVAIAATTAAAIAADIQGGGRQ